ncbi:hypothetical protein BIT28_00540 [Photobacterium proteolyticum]|uniref:Uncharacterized protein n=2 Tax=Photobacterium proteolyticum TaxID=1903952 RepID=A0A1Q9GX11_9GAMM|nr:hypothetical protein BIT28_00540 [Photobacterium proteolyticum]
MNHLYGINTVFCAKTLRGVSRFFLESLLDRRADNKQYSDGTFAKGPFKSDIDTIYKKPKEVYVYQVDIAGYEYTDVVKDLMPEVMKPKMINPGSRLLAFQENKRLNAGFLDFNEDYWYAKLHYYLTDCAIHTEEIIVKGPIKPKRIKCFQTLPMEKVF